ncbi:hypothetical protein [Profundibacter sp.]
MNIPLDKQGHFAAGLAISATLVAYGISPVTAFVAGLITGALKELLDPILGGQRDLADFVATAAGATGVLPLTIIPMG